MRKQIQEAFQKGLYPQALDLIEGTSQFEHFRMETLYHMARYSAILETNHNLITPTAEEIFVLLQNETFRSRLSRQITIINALIQVSKLEEATKYLEILIGLIPYHYLGTISKLDIESDDILLSPYALAIRIYEMQGHYANSKNNDIEAIGYYSLGYELSKKFNSDYYQMSCLYWISICYGFAGNLTLAAQKNQEALRLSEKLVNKPVMAYILGWRATWHFIRFELNEMYEVLHGILHMEDHIYDLQPVIFAHIYFGYINMLRGNLDSGLFHTNLSLTMIDNNENKQYLPLALFYFGILERSLKRTRESVTHFHKVIEIRRENMDQHPQNLISLGNTYYQLFLSYIDLNQLEDAASTIEELDKLYESSRNQYLNLMKSTAQSIYFKQMGTLATKVQAIDILREIMTQSIFEQGRFISTYALFILYELLFDEFVITNNEDILKESKELLERIRHSIENQGLTALYGEIILLQAKFSLMVDDFDKFQEYMESFNELTGEKELTLLSSKAKLLQVEFDEKISRITTVIESNKPLMDKIKIDEIKDYLDSLSEMMKRG